MGEITLPVYAKGINRQTKFNVADCSSAYNAILGPPWIHESCTFNVPSNLEIPHALGVVRKKNGKWRVCIDFTDLNKAFPKDPFPLPHIDSMDDATAGHELLTFMDAYSGYNLILMHSDDQEKTAFMTDKGIYCYKVMPFGLKNASSTYQRLVNMMFKEHLGDTMEVYIDDMLVKSKHADDHIGHLKQSFDILREYKMKLNPTKCSFGVRAGKFLGYMVTRRGIEANPEQIKVIVELKSPRNFKEVQRLTGHAETRYASIEELLLSLVMAAKKLRQNFESHPIIVVTNFPLKSVLRKPELTGRLAKWNIYLINFDMDFKPKTAIKSQVQVDFVSDFSPEMENTMTSDRLIVATLHDTTWKLDVDGSANIRGTGLGVVLQSPQGGKIEFAYDLGATHLHVRSDSSLVVNQVNGEFAAKDARMIAYYKIVKEKAKKFGRFVIEQIPRDQNTQADALANLGSALSQTTFDNVPIVHLTIPSIKDDGNILVTPIEEENSWSDDIRNYLENDQLPDDRMEARKVRFKASRYVIIRGQLYRRSSTGLNLRCITNKTQVQKILQDMHDGECGNHSGSGSQANRVSRQGYYWPSLRQDAIRYVQSCDACQKYAGMSHKPSEPLHSTLIPWPFMKWGMDIVGKLPPAPGQKSNGLAESSNKTIINSIKKRLKVAKGKWVEELPSVLWANRTTPRTSIGLTPFSLCEVVLPIEARLPTLRHTSVEHNLVDLSYDLDALEELREAAHIRMAAQKQVVERHFNKNVQIKVFQKGDYVLRRVFQNTQEVNAGKLSIKWKGPYQISSIMGKGAYKIQTLDGRDIPRSWNAVHLKRTSVDYFINGDVIGCLVVFGQTNDHPTNVVFRRDARLS
ncbi:hypothetical protein L6452_34870 [Arctium lappa]|uniref:Uncharacterized protein n=1 Tax=Arctium lappa TaxID=4217 RepID=A0ACB8YIM7_ARCLA|nr:hypothetical protein L6452_34870 [Arctium lappa]